MTGATLDAEFLSAPVNARCKVARQLEALGADDRAKFEVALGSEEASDKKIAEAFARRGLRVADCTVAAHRRGECCCVR